jgi:hypothetical protein
MVNCRSKKTFVFMLSWIAGGSNLFGSDWVDWVKTPGIVMVSAATGYLLATISKEDLKDFAHMIAGTKDYVNYIKVVRAPHKHYTSPAELVAQVHDTPEGREIMEDMVRSRHDPDHPDSEKLKARLRFDDLCRKIDTANYHEAMKIKAAEKERRVAHSETMARKHKEIEELERDRKKKHRDAMNERKKEERELLAQIDAKNKATAEAKQQEKLRKKEEQEGIKKGKEESGAEGAQPEERSNGGLMSKLTGSLKSA